jgi:hypothetical protein
MRLDDPVGEIRERNADKAIMRDRSNMGAILLILYSVPALSVGIILYLNAYAISEMAFGFLDDPLYASILDGYLDDYTVASLAAELELAMLMIAIGGMTGIASALLALLRRHWIITVALCAASAVFGIMMIFGTIVALIAIWLLYTSRPAFAE